MSTREFFAERLKGERKAFVNVLRAMPSDKLDYKPNEKNQSAGDIAWLLAQEFHQLKKGFDIGEIHWGPPPRPNDVETIVSEFEKAWDGVAQTVASIDDAKWNANVGMHFGGKLMATRPIGETAWFFLFDAIHHRGQLTAYLRPMGGKVPSVYGPTADDRGSGM